VAEDDFIGGATIGAKNEAPFPGRVRHVRRGVHGVFALIGIARLTGSQIVVETPWQKIFQGSPEPGGFGPCDGLSRRFEARRKA
jgi:hypothetical protein